MISPFSLSYPITPREKTPSLNHRQFGTEIVTVLISLGDLFEASGSSGEEAQEGLAGRKDSAQVLRVELYSDVPLMILQFNDFHTLAGLVLSNEGQSTLLQLADKLRVHLITVAMSFPDLLLLPVQLAQARPFSTRLEHSRPLSKAHCTTHLSLIDLRHVDDNRLLAGLIELGAACLIHTADMPSILDHSQLHTKANTKVGNVVGTGPLGSQNHTGRTSRTKATGDKNL